MEYTLDELVVAVGGRIAAAGLDRQANGQVSAFPDRRTLRYYTTIGLMDRPDTVRDRQAMYSDRHVIQAVAVKRLQASGLTLAAVQGQLAGLPLESVDAIAAGREGAEPAGGGVRPGRFWAHAGPATAPAAPSERAARPPSAAALLPPVAAVRPMLAIPLAPDATLLLATDRTLSDGDVEAIGAAAADLVYHLATAGLLRSGPGRDQDRRDSR